jgi:hypothetical protein
VCTVQDGWLYNTGELGESAGPFSLTELQEWVRTGDQKEELTVYNEEFGAGQGMLLHTVLGMARQLSTLQVHETICWSLLAAATARNGGH